MPGNRSDTIARLRVSVAAGLPPPPDLVADVLEFLERDEGAASRRAKRDALIRRGGMLLPPDRAYAKAAQLAGEAKAMQRTWHLLREREAEVSPGTVRGCLHAAALHEDLPRSHRQFYRVLKRRADD